MWYSVFLIDATKWELASKLCYLDEDMHKL